MAKELKAGRDDGEGAHSSYRKSEPLVRALIESIPGIFYLYDTSGHFLLWNDDFERVSGYSEEEVSHMHPLQFFAEDDKELLNERIQKVFERGEASVAAQFLTKSGERIPFFFTGKRVEFEGNTCLAGVGVDIAERVRVEEALKKSEQRFRSTLDGILEGCQLLDFDFRYLYLNGAAAVHNRRPNAELLGRRMPEAWPGIDQTPVFRMLARCQTERIALHEETEFAFPDGSTGWFDVRCEPVPEGIFVLSIEISERVGAKNALVESEQRFRQLAESVSDVFWLVDCELDVTCYISPTHTAVWCTDPAELAVSPLSWLAVVHPDDRERVTLSLLAYARGEWEQTFRISPPDHSVRWIRARSHPVRDAHGNIHRLAVVSRDVTELRNLEERLRQTQKMEAIGRLAAGVAHDFNNILSVILSYSSLILAEPTLDATTREDVLEIHESGERAADLTRQLLTISRQQVLRPRLLEVGQVLDSMRKMLQRLIGEDVQLTIVLGAEPSYVHVDQGQMEQVVMNLVVNARDAMPNGGKVTIEVSRQRLDEGYAASHPGVPVGDYVQLAVTDTGIGMDADVRERVFEPFFTTKEVGKGTGLGLSTVFGIVRQSAGHIYVYSEVGLGTTFKVFLPLRTEDAEHSASRPRRPSVAMGSETILVVEDDPQVRQVLNRVLRLNGYQVLLAENGPSAMALCESHPGKIDLCVTDIVMTGMSGPELSRRVAEKRPEMPVLFLSGYAQHAAIDSGFLASGVPFLQKPTTPESLLVKVREVLTRGSDS